jgi:hypothetical protein
MYHNYVKTVLNWAKKWEKNNLLILIQMKLHEPYKICDPSVSVVVVNTESFFH